MISISILEIDMPKTYYRIGLTLAQQSIAIRYSINSTSEQKTSGQMLLSHTTSKRNLSKNGTGKYGTNGKVGKNLHLIVVDLLYPWNPSLFLYYLMTSMMGQW